MVLESTKRKLYALSHNQCAFSGCKAEMYNPDEDVLVSQVAHIRSKNERGPRYDPTYTGNLDDIKNLILLCLDHHKIIDDNPETYTIEKLTQMKILHEKSFNVDESISDSYEQVRDYIINEAYMLSQDKDEILKHLKILEDEDRKPTPRKLRVETSWKYIKRNAPFKAISMLSRTIELMLSKTT